MAGFHEIQFPAGISYGSEGGPGYRTEIVVVDSGQEERISRWSQARRTYNVAFGIKSHADLIEVQEFFIARDGAANGFRFKDWLGFTTNTNSIGPVDDEDEKLVRVGDGGVDGDGTETQFQLVKRYVSGAQTIIRTLEKTIAASVTISIDGANQGSGWSVNSTTGIVTFTSAPLGGELVKGGTEHDVPVRFGEGADRVLSAVIEDFSSGSIPNIELVEIINTGPVDEEFYFGGANNYTISANVNITQLQGRVHRITASSGSLKVLLPDGTGGAIPGGGPHFYILNGGGVNTFTIKNNADSVTVATLAIGEGVIILYDDVNDVWYALKGS